MSTRLDTLISLLVKLKIDVQYNKDKKLILKNIDELMLYANSMADSKKHEEAHNKLLLNIKDLFDKKDGYNQEEFVSLVMPYFNLYFESKSQKYKM